MNASQSARTSAARGRLGAALRELLDVVVRADLDETGADEATDAVNALRERLDAVGPLGAYPMELSAIHREMGLVGGAAHPVGPQIEFADTPDGSVGTTTLGPVFEGGPGLVHGGVLALLLDHAMGHACVTSEYAAMTTELKLRYFAPTPIGRPLQVTARLQGTRGRKLLLTGEISVDGRVSVSADAVFMTLTESNVAAIFGSPA